MAAARLLGLGLLVLGLAVWDCDASAKARVADPGPQDSPVGVAIYLKGILGSGAPLLATRSGTDPVIGDQAACVNCHRRSGLGSQEARSTIPPITAGFLFRPKGVRPDRDPLPYIPGARAEREPYTDATLARAIRAGVDSEGHDLSYLMPRYALNDADMAALIAHLRALDHRREPGVSSTDLTFATIITPDADPVKRGAVLDVLTHFFEDRNKAPRGATGQTMSTSANTAYAKNMFKVNRHWVLNVWELTGPAATWGEQLDKKFAAQPVFAVVSGLGGKNWTPVQAFCERRSVPCLFPNVELPPPDADRDFHTLYFSRGVLLEADLIGATLTGRAAVRPPHVLQIYRAGDVGEGAAHALAAELQAQGVPVSNHSIAPGAAAGAVPAALREAGSGAVVLWLRAPDLAALGATAAPSNPVYLSGLMGGLEGAPLPLDWREHVHMAYPMDLAERRRVRVDYALAWFRIRKIPVVAEQVQTDTWLACGLVSETIKHMIDAFVPDYLVERLEDTMEHRVITGYYPRLALGPHQRFASKGGFLVHFDAAARSPAIPDGEWMSP